MTAGADERVTRLYGLPLAEFTAERNALAAELRAEGDADAAAAVKALRKPTAAAWAVNQIVRAEPDLVEALLGAGGELRQAHRQAASGKGAEQLRAAAESERAAVEQLIARAREVLGHAPGPALVDSIRNTLHAASSDDEARERIATGTLVTELRPVGLGPVPKGPIAASTRASSRRGGGTSRGGDKGKVTRSDAAARAAARAEAEREASRAAAENERLLKAAIAAERALEREAHAATRSLERADAALARAREAADAAEERARDARKRLRAATAELADARKRRTRLQQ